MKTIRRLYVYFVCAFALPWLLWAVTVLLINLLLPGIGNLGLAGTAFALSVVVIATPFYASHWFFAERAATRDTEEATAWVRQLYLYATVTWLLIRLLNLAYYLLFSILEITLQPARDTWYYRATWGDVGGMVIWFVVLLPVLGYHVYLLYRDSHTHPETEFTASLRRLTTYGFTAAGLIIFTIFLNSLIRFLDPVLNGGRVLGAATLITELPRLLISLPLWVAPWVWANWRFGKNKPGEVDSTLRKLYLYLSVFIAVLVALTNLTALLAGFFARLLNAPIGGNLFALLSLLVPAALIWVYHAIVLWLDSTAAPDTRQQSALRRLYNYQLAAIGLGALLAGVAALIALLISLLAGDQTLQTFVRQSLAWILAGLFVGLGTWLYHFILIVRAGAGTSEAANFERNSIIRRIYYYFFVLLASLTVLGASVGVLSQLLGVLIGARTTRNLVTDIALALAYLIVALIVGGIHAAVIAADNRANQAYTRQRLTSATVVLLPAGDATLDDALRTAFAQRLPELTPHWLPARLDDSPPAPAIDNDSTPPAPEAEPKPTPAERLAAADLVLAPLSAFTDHPADTATWAAALAASPAFKLILPAAVGGWRTPGLDRTRPDQIADTAVRTIQRFVDQDALEGRQTRSAGEIVGIVIGVILSLILFGLPIGFLLRQVIY